MELHKLVIIHDQIIELISVYFELNRGVENRYDFVSQIVKRWEWETHIVALARVKTPQSRAVRILKL